MDKTFMDLYARFGPAAALEGNASAGPNPARKNKRSNNAISDKQLAANRANSQRSTGPRTPDGKANSSLNNLKLGLSARTFAVLSCESQEEFDAYTRDLLDQYKPANMVESTLVLKMAQHHWLGQRAFLAQDSCFDEDVPFTVTDPEKQRQLALYLRYQANHDRAFYTCLRELHRLQAQRREADQTVASEARKEAIENVRFEIAALKRDREQWRNEGRRPGVPATEIKAVVPAVQRPLAAEAVPNAA